MSITTGHPDQPEEKNNDRRDHQVRLETAAGFAAGGVPESGARSVPRTAVYFMASPDNDCHTVPIASRSPVPAPRARLRLAATGDAQATVATWPFEVPTNISSPFFHTNGDMRKGSRSAPRRSPRRRAVPGSTQPELDDLLLRTPVSTAPELSATCSRRTLDQRRTSGTG